MNSAKFKEFVKDHGKEIAVSLTVGTVIGGIAVYAATGQFGKLVKTLKEYGDALIYDLNRFSDDGTFVFTATPGHETTMGNLGEITESIIKSAKDDLNRENSIVTGVVVFVKDAES